MKYMLDTNICAYIINKKPESTLAHLRSKLYEGLCISTIVLSELHLGIQLSSYQEKNTLHLNQFLSIVKILPFDEDAAIEFGIISANLRRKGTPIGPLDTLIAAHAISKGLIIATNNIREFSRVDGLMWENWAN